MNNHVETVKTIKFQTNLVMSGIAVCMQTNYA